MKSTEGLVLHLVEKTKGRWHKQVYVSVKSLCAIKDHLVGLVVFVLVLSVHMTQSPDRFTSFTRIFL